MSDKALSLDGAKTLYNDLRARVTSKSDIGHTHTNYVQGSVALPAEITAMMTSVKNNLSTNPT